MKIKNTINCRRAFSGMLLGGLLMAQAASAQIWTHVASACVPDESSFGQYQFAGASAKFSENAPTVNAAIVLRCNVANPMDFGGPPPLWNTLWLGGADPDGVGGPVYAIRAQLVAVNKVTGALLPIAATGGPPVAVPPLNFVQNAYYVEITLTRNGPLNPAVWYVGID